MANHKKRLIRAFKRSRAYKKETNDQAAKKILQGAGTTNCSQCPPWKHDNRVGKGSMRGKKYGKKKPKYKNKRQ